MKNKYKILVLGFLIIIASCNQHTDKQKEKSVDPNQTAITDMTQENEEPGNQINIDNLNDLPESITQFIPENYSALNVAKGDLNLDSIDDIILVLKEDNEEETSLIAEDPVKRPLYILTGQPDKSFKFAEINDNVVYCVNCGGMMGDPFMGIVIKNGYFSVEHYGGSAWRWSRIVTFKFNRTEKKWFLHKDGGDSFHTSQLEKVETKVKTVKDFGVVPFEEYDIYE